MSVKGGVRVLCRMLCVHCTRFVDNQTADCVYKKKYFQRSMRTISLLIAEYESTMWSVTCKLIREYFSVVLYHCVKQLALIRAYGFYQRRATDAIKFLRNM